MDPLSRLISVARGDLPADLLLRGGRVVNVFSGEIESVDIAIVDGMIAGVGEGYESRGAIDLDGAYVCPGFIDAHVHIESSLCCPSEFAKAIVARGVTTVVTDPHEIANVAGARGVEYIHRASRGLPLEVIVMAPSCVPATHMASSGASIDVADIASLRAAGLIHGLAEVMNFPGVINNFDDVRSKLNTMIGRPIDGHAPGVRGKSLNAYIAAGVGSDHECVTVDEAREKLNRGLYLLIREATNARNLDTLLPLVTRDNARRICFCTDDRTPGDLLRQGSIDYMVRRAIEKGVAPIDAIRMATLNPAEWFGLPFLGAIAPGRLASLIVFDDLQKPTAKMVFARGELVARDGVRLEDVEWEPAEPIDTRELGRCMVDWPAIDFRVVATTPRARVIVHQPNQLITGREIVEMKIESGNAVADVSRDILKMAVIERHRASGNCGLGFIQGIGLKRGAIAGTVAHDHHNLVIIGADDASMRLAGECVTDMNGGLCVVDGGTVIASLPLSIAGLMSELPVHDVAERYDRLVAAAKGLGSPLADPFMAMSFMALEVIPSLKLTDHGLVDVELFKVVSLFV
jgi:adenine deaminase